MAGAGEATEAGDLPGTGEDTEAGDLPGTGEPPALEPGDAPGEAGEGSWVPGDATVPAAADAGEAARIAHAGAGVPEVPGVQAANSDRASRGPGGAGTAEGNLRPAEDAAGEEPGM
jgi:hypothetical protein